MNKENKEGNVKVEGNKVNTETQENKKSNKGLIIGIIVATIIVVLGVGGYLAYNQGLFAKVESILGLSHEIPVGNYDLVEMVDGDTTYTKEQLNSLKSFGLAITLEIKGNRTGALNMYGKPEEITYDGRNIVYNDKSTPYTFEENKLIFEADGYKLVFEKNED